MIPTLRSKRELTVSTDNRSGFATKGLVETEITEIDRILNDDSRILKVVDYLIIPFEAYYDDILQQEVPSGERKQVLKIKGNNFKLVKKTKEEFEQIETYIKSAYPDANFNEWVAYAFLADMQSKPTYNSTSNDWEIKQP